MRTVSPDNEPSEQPFVSTETCRTNPCHSYEICIPADDQANPKRPLLVVIDPEGDGDRAVKHFICSASAYGITVVSSNLIKNGNLHYLKEINELTEDVTNRFLVGDTVFLAGFSGGARMAMGYARFRKVAGVLACGALAPNELLRRIQSRVFCIMGYEDYNFQEVAPYVLNPTLIPSNLAIEISGDSHQWPTWDKLSSSLEYLILASDLYLPSRKALQVRSFVSKLKMQLHDCIRENDKIRAALIAANLANVQAFDKDGSFRDQHNRLSQDENYRSQTALLSQSLLFEEKMKQGFLHALFYKETGWWIKEMESLNERINEEEDGYMLMAYRRLKTWLGIASHSVCCRYEKEKEVQKLERALFIFRQIQPDSPEVQRLEKVASVLSANRE